MVFGRRWCSSDGTAASVDLGMCAAWAHRRAYGNPVMPIRLRSSNSELRMAYWLECGNLGLAVVGRDVVHGHTLFTLQALQEY